MSGSHLQNGELVHLLPRTCRYHIFQHAKLLVHLGPPPALDQAVGRLASNLPACRSRVAWLLLLPTGGRRLCGRGGRIGGRRLLVRLLGLHLDDFARASRRRRQRVVILGDDALGVGRALPRCWRRLGRGRRRGWRQGPVGRVRGVGCRRRAFGGAAAGASYGGGGQGEGLVERASIRTVLAGDVGRGRRGGREAGTRHDGSLGCWGAHREAREPSASNARCCSRPGTGGQSQQLTSRGADAGNIAAGSVACSMACDCMCSQSAPRLRARELNGAPNPPRATQPVDRRGSSSCSFTPDLPPATCSSGPRLWPSPQPWVHRPPTPSHTSAPLDGPGAPWNAVGRRRC